MPKINGKEYPYTTAGKAAAKRAAKKAAPAKKKVADAKAVAQSKQMMKDRPRLSGTATTTSRSLPKPPAMNKAIPGNKGGGINLGAAAKKFVMSMPPVVAAKTAAKAGRAIGNAINPAPTERMYKNMGRIGDLRPMPDKPRNAKPVPMPAPRQRGTTRPVPMPAPRQRGTTKKMMGR
jgi:hypothetical protein